MKRSGYIARKTPLKRGGWLKRTEWKPKKRKPGIPTLVRRFVYERSGGMCEIELPGICTGRAVEIDHIKNQSQLGDHAPGNLQATCRPCHRFKTENPNAAHELGIYRRSWE